VPADPAKVWGSVGRGEGRKERGRVKRGFRCFSEGAIKLFEWLVVGVERIGSELARVNERLEGLEEVIWEYVDNTADDITDEGMNQRW